MSCIQEVPLTSRTKYSHLLLSRQIATDSVKNMTEEKTLKQITLNLDTSKS